LKKKAPPSVVATESIYFERGQCFEKTWMTGTQIEVWNPDYSRILRLNDGGAQEKTNFGDAITTNPEVD